MDLVFMESIYKEKMWGGEEWLVSAHPHGETIIKNGINKGKKLSEIYPNFPLLVKIIDAKDDLSIQVHPDDEYAKKVNSRGKSECWYVLEAKENASLIIGHNAKDKEEFCSMVKNGEWGRLLREVKVKKGDFFQIDPGTIHSIKGGVKLLEIQQSSDITYRLYDYDRFYNGEKRELHIEDCLNMVRCPYEASEFKQMENQLINCPFYTVKKIKICDEGVLKAEKQCVIAVCIDGEGYVCGMPLSKGDVFIIPPYSRETVKGEVTFVLCCEPV